MNEKEYAGKPKIGILNKIVYPDIELEAVNGDALIECLNVNNENDLPDTVEKYDAVIVSYRFSISSFTIDKLKSCKAIITASVGFDNVDWLYASKKGIRVFNVPDYGTNDVADHVFALLLTYVRRILCYDSLLRINMQNNWRANLVSGYHRITGTSFGIIGLGRIGSAVALRAKAFGMIPYFYDPYKPSGYDRVLQINRVYSLQELFSKCKIISVHAPLTSETLGMIDYSLMSQSRNNPILINTARGKIVKSDDVYKALKNGVLEAFLADVLDTEPPDKLNPLSLYGSDPFLTDKVIITPHSASYAEESQYDMRFKSAQIALLAVIDNNFFTNCVNMED